LVSHATHLYSPDFYVGHNAFLYWRKGTTNYNSKKDCPSALVSQFVCCYLVFEERRHNDQILAGHKSDIGGIGFLRLCIEQYRCLISTDKENLAVPPAGDERAVVEDDEAVTAGHFGVDDFRG